MSTQQRFYLPIRGASLETVIFSPDQSHQISQVLRLQEGDTVSVFDGTGAEYLVELEELSRKKAVGSIQLKTYPDTELPFQLNIYHGALKSKGEAFVIQKASELGSTALIPVNMARTVQKTFNQEHYQYIAIEACEVVGRVKIPEVMAPISWKSTLERVKKNNATGGLTILFWEETPFENTLAKLFEEVNPQEHKEINLIFGPEGGLTREEVALFEQDCHIVSLGKRVVRAETAAILGIAGILHQF